MKLVTLALFLLSSICFAHELEFINSVRLGKLSQLKTYLDQGVDPNTSYTGINGEEEKAAVFFAIENEKVDALKLLLIYGADINKTAKNNKFEEVSPLMFAVQKYANFEGQGKMAEIIKLLISQKFKVAGKEYRFKTDLYFNNGKDDLVSTIAKSNNRVDALGLLYSSKNINISKFIHNDLLVIKAVENGNINFLNIYLEFNSKKVDSDTAKKSLVLLSSQFGDSPKLVNLELIERLRKIAFQS